jgi:hypothetical protein
LLVTLSIPFLVLAVGGIGQATGESCALATEGADSPPILDDAELTAEQLVTWWSSTRRDQPAGLDLEVAEVIRLYLSEGDAEGVRGDLAWAQAVHETGYFTSSDTQRNNFAGIAHHDGAGSGRAFGDVAEGVRAHIQLLKKFAAGNDAQLAARDVAPDAGARATTWADLAGTWASDPSYWTSLSRLFAEMRQASGRETRGAGPDLCKPDGPANPATGSEPMLADGAEPTLTTVRGITVNAAIAGQLEQLLDAAEADGLLLNGSGYRSHDRQIELRRAHCGTSPYGIYEMPSSQCSPPTARPGSSMHEQGLAIDFVNCSTRSTRCWRWLSENATSFGFYELAGGREPWHWSTTGT